MAYRNWAEVSHELRSTLDLLNDRGFLVLGEPVAESVERRGLLRRRRPRPARYVQVLRTDEVLSAECVGAVSLGGTWEMSESTVADLRAMGWRTPAENADEWGSPSPNFTLHVSWDQAEELEDLLVASLRVLGAAPHQLVLTGG